VRMVMRDNALELANRGEGPERGRKRA